MTDLKRWGSDDFKMTLTFHFWYKIVREMLFTFYINLILRTYKCYLSDVENLLFLFKLAKVKHPIFWHFFSSDKSKECFGIVRTSPFQMCRSNAVAQKWAYLPKNYKNLTHILSHFGQQQEIDMHPEVGNYFGT